MSSQILITMDDLETAVPLNAAFEAAGFSTAMFSSLDDARGTVRREEPELVILTGAVHEPHAEQLVSLARDSEISTLALLEPTDSERGHRVGRLGVTEIIVKPVQPDDAVATARRLIERRKLQQRTGIIGESAPIQEVLVKIEQMAPVSSTVLIQGESGTGKELVAKGIHDLSPRRGKPFIAVNCAALPDTLLESELFGHEKGAFTGAAERRLGRFELADGGTIFLDEIGDVSASTQVKLLRVLETRTFFRVGGTQPIRWTSASSPRQTGRFAMRSHSASYGTTSTTGSASSTCTSRLFASGEKTSPSSSAGSSGHWQRSTTEPSAASRPTPWSGSSTRPGPATSASSAT